ncbi:MAG: hypothetical protein E6J97_09310 [Methanobacteriota archaeon]|nr:MAG: hypothetical protein E6J97_09310 [Euryarchaeota archaeon]
MGFRMQGRKTTTRAFRIDETVDRQLREWAEREGVSVSFLANKALRRLVEWDMYADRFGFIAMPREALSRMIELLSEDEVRDLGRWAGADVYRAFTTFMFKHLDLETVLQVMPKLIRRKARRFADRHRLETRLWPQVLLVLRGDGARLIRGPRRPRHPDGTSGERGGTRALQPTEAHRGRRRVVRIKARSSVY